MQFMYISLDEFRKLVHEDTEKFCAKFGITDTQASALLGSLTAPDKADYKEELVNSMTEKYL